MPSEEDFRGHIQNIHKQLNELQRFKRDATFGLWVLFVGLLAALQKLGMLF